MLQKSSILTIAPYKIIPANTGGHLSITLLHHYIGRLCQVHLAGTVDNGAADAYSFTLHRVFPSKPTRYLPFYGLPKLAGIAKRYDATAIICEHPYMAFTAMLLSRRLRIPWYMRSQNIESERFRTLGKKWWRMLSAYEQFAMRQSDGVFFITPEEMHWAQDSYKMPAEKCFHIPYGTELSVAPQSDPSAKTTLAAQHGLNPDIPWIYFLGSMNYKPNADAARLVLDELLPRVQQKGFSCELLIAGKGLDKAIQQRIAATSGIQYMGFVDSLDQFIKACDVMVNPVLSGGGIKTKAVEALAYSKRVVSTHAGAQGILPAVCGDNLAIVADDDWDGFANEVVRVLQQPSTTPAAFYNEYYWGNIAGKVLEIIRSNTSR